MSHPCAIAKCNRASRAPCDCCQQDICLQHLNEHNASLVFRLHPLTDEINAVGNRLDKLNIQEALDDSRRKLEQWRDDCHQKIDGFFAQKYQELDGLIEMKVGKQREEIKQIQSKMVERIQEQETTRQEIDLLTSNIRRLEENMTNIEQICFQINTRSLVIDDSFIHIQEMNEHEIDLSTLSSVYKTINRSNESYTSLTSNERYLLMHQAPNLCLVDREMNIVKQVEWSYYAICDMCWLPMLARFIIIEKENVFLVDQNTMSIDIARMIETRKWRSCTFSNSFLFLSTWELGSSIAKFSLLPSIKLVREWKSPHTCAKNEIIHDIVCNNDVLALMVMNGLDKNMWIELKSSETLDRIWLFRLNIVRNEGIQFRCCLLTGDEWLVADYNTNRLLYISKDGKLKKTIEYSPTPYRATLFGPKLLVVSTKNGGINFHKL
jgi:gas vesicle protein